MIHPIHPRPSRAIAAALLDRVGLPTSDLTDAHMDHFFYAGDASAPSGLVGLEVYRSSALLRSLAVAPDHRSTGLGSALVEHAESHARTLCVSRLFLLTTAAEPFFHRLGYRVTPREGAPQDIRSTREFADLCPASSVFMAKRL
jgi:amino-acid N-acetyltransferase